MTAELLLRICNVSVLPCWALLLLFPRWRWSARIICGVVAPIFFALVYLVLLVSQWSVLEGGFSSLSGVAKLFENRYALLAGWVHYLAFDLFIGAWEVRDSQRQGIHHIFVVPCLLLTFLLGPIGLLLYLSLRGGLKRKYSLDPENV